MKRSKIIIYSLFALIFSLATMLFFAKKSYAFEESILIDAPDSTVFNYVKFLKNQEEYHDWFKMDQDKMLDYSGEDGVVGANCNWRSKMTDVGVGKQQIVKLDYPREVLINMEVESPIIAHANHCLKIAVEKGKSKLTFSIQIYLHFPYNIQMMFNDFDTEVGASMLQSLKNIRSAVE